MSAVESFVSDDFPMVSIECDDLKGCYLDEYVAVCKFRGHGVFMQSVIQIKAGIPVGFDCYVFACLKGLGW